MLGRTRQSCAAIGGGRLQRHSPPLPPASRPGSGEGRRSAGATSHVVPSVCEGPRMSAAHRTYTRRGSRRSARVVLHSQQAMSGDVSPSWSARSERGDEPLAPLAPRARAAPSRAAASFADDASDVNNVRQMAAPAVVLVQGRGWVNRDNEVQMGTHAWRPMRDVAEFLAARGTPVAPSHDSKKQQSPCLFGPLLFFWDGTLPLWHSDLPVVIFMPSCIGRPIRFATGCL